jgi:hypothetical protein
MAACGPEVRLDPPAGWPPQWADRSLYHTPNAYIYASGNAAAGEADRFVDQRAQRFRQQYGRAPAKGLVIVTDKGDDTFTPDLGSLVTIVAGEEVGLELEGLSEEAVEHQLLLIEGIASSVGVDVSVVCFVAALPLGPQEMSSLIEIPADGTEAFGWAAAVPTRSASRDAVRTHARKLVKQHLGFIGAIAVAPFMPLAVDMAVKALVEDWEDTIDEQMLEADQEIAPILAGQRQEDQRHFEAFEEFTVDDLKPGE